jgi:hypothetical protein
LEIAVSNTCELETCEVLWEKLPSQAAMTVDDSKNEPCHSKPTAKSKMQQANTILQRGKKGKKA